MKIVKEWIDWLAPAVASVLAVIFIVLTIAWGVMASLNYFHRATHITARVTKLFQSQHSDYMRVITDKGDVTVWGAWPEVWGLVEEGMTCSFEVRDETPHVAVSAVCQVGDK